MGKKGDLIFLDEFEKKSLPLILPILVWFGLGFGQSFLMLCSASWQGEFLVILFSPILF